MACMHCRCGSFPLSYRRHEEASGSPCSGFRALLLLSFSCGLSQQTCDTATKDALGKTSRIRKLWSIESLQVLDSSLRSRLSADARKNPRSY
eukprot:960718-Amphidinium_carterae.1